MEISLYTKIIKLLENNNKPFDDILYITSVREERWDENSPSGGEFNIPIEAFIEVSKTIDPLYIEPEINIVGRDFYITSDTMDGYFDFISIPQKKNKTINLTKELLQYPDEKPGVLLGMESPDQDD